MKKRNLLLVSTLMLSFFMVNAQSTEKGDMILNFGFGLGNNYTASGGGLSKSIPPISVSYEYVVKDDLFGDGKGELGVGALVQYMNYKYDVTYNSNIDGEIINALNLKSAMVSASGSVWKYNKFIIGPRAFLHYNFLEKLDTYTGLMLGLNFVSWGNETSDYKHTAFTWAWVIGGRYYFNDNLAALLELGYGATYANIGIAYNFGN